MARSKILVIDDSEMIATWAKLALQDEQIEIVHHGAGMTAAAAVVRQDPALIILDCAMRFMVEDKLIDAVKRSVSLDGVPIVLFAEGSDAELHERVKRHGLAGHLTKGTSRQSFAEVIRRHLHHDAAAGEPSQAESAAAESSPSLGPRSALPAPGVTTDRLRAASVRRARSAAVASDDGRRHIIIAGEPLRHASVTLLESDHYSISALSSGTEVCNELAARPTSLVILGPKLTDLGAITTCSRIRSDPALRRVSVVYVGDAPDAAQDTKISSAGANAVLTAPLDQGEFRTLVERLASVALRRDARLLVRLDVKLGDGGNFMVGSTHNLSESGMLLETTNTIEPGAELALRFFLPRRSEEIHTPAVVVRQQPRPDEPALAGVRFIGIAAADRQAIKAFIDASGPQAAA